MKGIVSRFIKYVSIDTQANEKERRCPSNENQQLLAELLQDELKNMGIQEVEIDDKSFLYALLPSNTDEDVPAVAFLAHLDTNPDVRGANIRPRIIENYGGGKIVLNEKKKLNLDPEVFPALDDCIGEDLIVTDGTTLLGADGKAGIAEIMEAVQYFCEHPEIPHGDVSIVFTPDEELGYSTDYITMEKVPAEFGFTVEGGSLGEINCENFNAAISTITVNGSGIHPGAARNKMKNAVLLAHKFMACLPEGETPAGTENYEGYYHISDIRGSVEQCIMTCHIREFGEEKYEERKKRLLNTAAFLNEYYGEGTFEVQTKDYYLNMKEVVEKHPLLLRTATEAMLRAGVKPKLVPVRGGTDGVTISFMGLPCPNIFSGEHNSFSIYEFISIQTMEKAAAVIVNIIKLLAEHHE